MKKNILLVVALFVFSVFTYAQNSTNKVELSVDGKASFKWKAVSIDFGEIKHNVPKTAEFELSNTGTSPIIISNAIASCGCTNVDFPKDPIKPGQTAKIKTTYNAAATGAFQKSVTVYMNATPEPQVLELKGVVK
ncbi:MAG TPA: DUF1573 domain-containing protein [Bacteroidales bacterium]|jgi:hypothetical protein|nr:DUF1573 domain-containing protein [Bacteroidales bacterium]